MGFRYCGELARLIQTDKSKAHAKLVSLFKRHRTKVAVANHLGVNRETLYRWLRKLEDEGLDPVAEAKKAA